MSDVGASTQTRRSDGTGPRALILADSSTAMGQGHLMRCQTLALALLARGWQVQLVGQALEGHGLKRAVAFFQQAGYHVRFTTLDASATMVSAMDVCAGAQADSAAPSEFAGPSKSATPRESAVPVAAATKGAAAKARPEQTCLQIVQLPVVMPFVPEQRASPEAQQQLAVLLQSLVFTAQTATSDTAANSTTALLVVDHYSIDQPFYQALQHLPLCVAAIDDLANRPLPVELLLDQNFQASAPSSGGHAAKPPACNVQTAWRYQGLLPRHCVTLIGPRYALLRDEFVARQVNVAALAVKPQIQRLLISLGGSDPTRFTETLLAALRQATSLSTLPWLADCQIDVVVGSAYPNLPALQAQVEAFRSARLHVQTSDMATLIANADLCIGATGGSTWERALLGCPTLAYWLAPNQVPALQALARIDAIVDAGPAAQFDADNFITLLAEQTSTRRATLAKNARQLMGEGSGAASVARALNMLWQSHQLSCRKVAMDDAELLLDWANDPEVRSQGFYPEPIAMATHVAWLERRLQASDELFYVVCLHNTPIAQVRFSPKTELSGKVGAEIHISVAKTARGQGLASAVLQASVREALSSPVAVAWQFVDALVRCSNLASSVAFQRAGFMEFSDTDIKGIACRWLRRSVGETL